jgi:hypothetical protein
MMRLSLIALSAAMAAMLVVPAAAEDLAAPPKASVVMETSVPKKPDCAQPKLPQRLPAAKEEEADLIKRVNAYATCTTRYINERRTQAQKHAEFAKEESEVSNMVVKELNDFYAAGKQLLDGSKKASSN